MRFRKIVLLLLGILFFSVAISIIKGSVDLPFAKLFLKENQPIIVLRVCRILMAIVTGSGLAISGIVLQAILRNSLAEPYILGTSSGAGLGAVLGVVLGVSWIYLPLVAFSGAILSIVLVYNLARQNGRIADQSLILSGVIVSVALSALIVFLVSISGNEAMHGMLWWLWGSFQVSDIRLLFIVSIVVFLGIGIIYLFAQELNAIAIGEEEAIHLGIDVELIKKILLLVSALITASLVCICGIIGFVGLMIPHMMRRIAGPNHKTLIPLTCIGAAIFMVVCDLISRIIWPPLEIPIGVITAILGAPVFIVLLKKNIGS
jgi:iron complex transport system permease protein